MRAVVRCVRATNPDSCRAPAGTTLSFTLATGAGRLGHVDDRVPAEDLPHLYRAVLDTVARLEHAGDRDFAWRVRRDALRTYSTRWDAKGRRSLERLHRDAQARLAATPRTLERPSLSATTGTARP